MTEIDSLERLSDPRLIAERMTDRVHANVAVDVRALDHQRVAIPVTHGFTPPRRREVLCERAPVSWDQVKPGVLFGKENDLVIFLNDVNRMRPEDGSWKPKR